ncbi:MAG: IS3 family transposase [Treponema sp.]|nr:IS3 family transposase [Treponema sp.]
MNAYRFMKQHKERYSVTKMAKVFGVSRSGYYAFEGQGTSLHEKVDLELSGKTRQIFEDNHGRYGSPRVWEELKGLGWHVSRKRIERLMREMGLRARRRRKRVKTTDSDHKQAVAENILKRDFHAENPGEKWVSDITYLGTTSGWLYLTVILDLWDRKVIGWAMSEELTAEPVSRALAMAVGNRQPREGLIFHSDRGVQYCSEEFRSTLYRLCPTVRQSMSRKGNCWDNACAESFFSTLKAELEELGRRCDKKQIKTAVFEYIEIYYNRCRRHSALGYATPLALTNNIAA